MGLGFHIIERRPMDRSALPSWSYSGFNRFRTKLAALCGIDLEKMEGFARDGGKEWPSPEAEPLVPLLSHSDCDGTMTPDECATVAPRLRELLPKLDDPYDREMGAKLAALMEIVADGESSGATLVFC